MQTEQRFRELLDRYLAGTCTPVEKAVIEEWFERGGDMGKAGLHLDAAELSRLLANIHQLQDAEDIRSVKPSGRRLWPGGWRAAALWTGLLITAGIGIWKSGQIKKIFNTKQSPVAFTTISTGKGEIKQVVLPDSSVVLLNAGSVLRYHPDFISRRELHLSGEALFTVTRDEAHPFTVLAADSLSTTVLGTQFNINSYDKGEEVQITVVSGKVSVARPGNSLSTLTRAQAISYHRAGGKFTIFSDIATESLTSWAKGEWEYENARFSDMALLLQNQYGITLVSRRSRKELQTQVSVNFNRKQSAREIMDVFCSLAGCRFREVSPVEIEIY